MFRLLLSRFFFTSALRCKAALFIFSAAAAGAWIVTTGVRKFAAGFLTQSFRELFQGFSGLPVNRQALDDRPGMDKKLLESRTKVVQPFFSVRADGDPVFRASAIAPAEDFTSPATFRQPATFMQSECVEERTLRKVGKCALVKISEAMIGVHEVVAAKQPSVMFKHENISTGLAENTKRVRQFTSVTKAPRRTSGQRCVRGPSGPIHQKWL